MRFLAAALLICAAVACGPNAARVVSGGPTPDETVTLATWKPVPTVTPVPAWAITPTARPLAVPPPPTPIGGRPVQVAPALTATPALPERPFPTPTPPPPAQCHFASGVVSVPVPGPVSGAITPGVVPSFYRGSGGLMTVARGEPLPGVVLELRLPGTTFVVGGVVSPEVRVQNGSAGDIHVFANVVAATNDQKPIPSDERSILNGGAGGRSLFPGDPGRTVPAGQTWSFPTTVQLPFDAGSTVHLVASAGLSTPGSSAVGHYTDIPVKLTTATPTTQLQVELPVDRRQWCMRATTANGAVQDGPLFVSMQATVAGGGRSFYGPERIDRNTWAGYWNPMQMQSTGLLSVSVWVGGANYPTTRTEVSTS